MGLQEFWFVLVGVLFLGFFILEGFDFGVGMLMEPFGRVASGDPEQHRRAALNTIGPVWDGNEVWLLTAGGAMFAAYPGWYATVFSTLYLPLLVILLGMIVRVVAIEWRGKIDNPRWRRWADLAIGVGSWLPAVLWGVAFAILVRGLPIDAENHVLLSVTDVLNVYTLLGGLATCALFLLHGAVYVALKTEGPLRDDAFRFARWLSVPVLVLVGAFGMWTQLVHGKPWTWVPLLVAVIALLVAVSYMRSGRGEGRAFIATTTVVAAVVILLFGCLYPNLVPSTLDPAYSLTIYNASSSHYTLTVMTWAAVLVAPVVIGYQAWSYWVFRQRISAHRIPPSVGLATRVS